MRVHPIFRRPSVLPSLRPSVPLSRRPSVTARNALKTLGERWNCHIAATDWAQSIHSFINSFIHSFIHSFNLESNSRNDFFLYRKRPTRGFAQWRRPFFRFQRKVFQKVGFLEMFEWMVQMKKISLNSENISFLFKDEFLFRITIKKTNFIPCKFMF